jgi:hypothetical protein
MVGKKLYSYICAKSVTLTADRDANGTLLKMCLSDCLPPKTTELRATKTQRHIYVVRYLHTIKILTSS